MIKKIRLATLYILICCLSYLFLISYPDDKLSWYDAPLYPLLALLIGILFYVVYYYLKKLLKTNELPAQISIVCISMVLFYKPAIQICNKVQQYGTQNNNGDPESNYAKKLYTQGFTFDYKIFYTQPVGNNIFQLYFYRTAYHYNKGINIIMYDSIPQLKINDTVMVCQADKKELLNKFYDYKIINNWNNCMLVVINKPHTSAMPLSAVIKQSK